MTRVQPPRPTPYPHQLEGVEFLRRRDGRALIADDPGLGKTGTTLLWLDERPELDPVVVVCPATVRHSWVKEIRLWTRQSAFLPYGTASDDAAYSGQPFIVVHYDILAGDSTVNPDTRRIEVGPRSWLAWLRALQPRAVVIDECHLIRSTSALRTKAVKALCRGVPHVIALSGTPVVNRPVEAYNAIQLTSRPEDGIPNWPKFTKTFCGPKFNGFAMTYSGASNLDELHDLLSRTIMIRRRKADVLKDLPPKVRQWIPLDLSNWREYREAEADFIRYLHRREGGAAARRARRAESIARMTRLRGIAAAGKTPGALDWVSDVVYDEKLIAFAVRRSMLDALSARFGNVSVRIDGDVPQERRGEVVDRFQEDPDCRLFVGQMQAAGVGITLTAASRVGILELPWTPVDVLQAEDRAHRIGQRDSVNVGYLLAKGTIDEDMAEVVNAKMMILDQVVDGAYPEDADGSILEDLIERIRVR